MTLAHLEYIYTVANLKIFLPIIGHLNFCRYGDPQLHVIKLKSEDFTENMYSY